MGIDQGAGDWPHDLLAPTVGRARPATVRILRVRLIGAADVALAESVARSGMTEDDVFNRALVVYDAVHAETHAGYSLALADENGGTRKVRPIAASEDGVGPPVVVRTVTVGLIADAAEALAETVARSGLCEDEVSNTALVAYSTFDIEHRAGNTLVVYLNDIRDATALRFP